MCRPRRAINTDRDALSLTCFPTRGKPEGKQAPAGMCEYFGYESPCEAPLCPTSNEQPGDGKKRKRKNQASQLSYSPHFCLPPLLVSFRQSRQSGITSRCRTHEIWVCELAVNLFFLSLLLFLLVLSSNQLCLMKMQFIRLVALLLLMIMYNLQQLESTIWSSKAPQVASNEALPLPRKNP